MTYSAAALDYCPFLDVSPPLAEPPFGLYCEDDSYCWFCNSDVVANMAADPLLSTPATPPFSLYYSFMTSLSTSRNLGKFEPGGFFFPVRLLRITPTTSRCELLSSLRPHLIEPKRALRASGGTKSPWI